ncbi:neprilysin-2-like isoform X2 [Sitodiplosis mosellana]|uniref:neprilysin-2-like isoform X2 n=1 Tax=Sitodiplosis mosellana TaxID=263140 RepID=UPI002444EFE7|nr:neprilysin-2-like isoform X2 [Sitodiplosis mosellana]
MCGVFFSTIYSNVWQRRTTLEKVLLTFYVILGAIAVTSLVFYFIVFNGSAGMALCFTSGCITAASHVLNAMDTTIEPCNDFYQFTCGNFVKNTYIPDDKLTVDTFSTLADEIDIQLRTIIEDEIAPKESNVFALVKNLHKSCMNRTAVEAFGLEPFRQILRQIGGWPAVEGEQWNETIWDWIESIREMREIGLTTNYLLATSIGAHLKNSSTRSLRVDQPDFGLAREFLLNEKDPMLQHYYDYMVDITVIFGANVSTAPYELLDVLNFERALANISLPAEERRDGESQFNPYTISELETKYPHIRWTDYFSAIMPKEMKLSSTEVVVVVSPIYFERLAFILQNTTKRTIANYFAWRSFIVSSNFLNDLVRIRKIQYLSAMTGNGDGQPGQSGTSQWKECISYTTSTLSPAVGALYVRKYFNDKTKGHAEEIVENIRSSFIEMLHKVTWMDEKTKNAAIDKATKLTAHIAYPKELTNNTKLEEYYSSLEMKDDEYLMNALRLNKFKAEYALRELYDPVNKNDWLAHATPAMTNAFYSALENSIQFPAGILQGKFLSEHRPNYMNYGSIGQIIGHEITHGFDDLGRQFDLNGNLKDWWLPETKSKFLNRTQCITEQYGNFTEPKLKMPVNGKSSLGENIADNGGMKSAYFAYKKWTQKNGAERRLPGLQQYTAEQMFWIAAAQTWCSASRDWYTKMAITVDSHAPSRFRVIGSVKNNKEFAKDFNCASGTPMNPSKKCEIW